jgi:hypothetical protein
MLRQSTARNIYLEHCKFLRIKPYELPCVVWESVSILFTGDCRTPGNAKLVIQLLFRDHNRPFDFDISEERHEGSLRYLQEASRRAGLD